MKRFLSIILTVVMLSVLLLAGRPMGRTAAVSGMKAAAAAVEEAAAPTPEKPAYCLYCSRVHSGFTGFFVKIAHRIAWYFCQLFKIERTEGRMRFTEITVDAGAEEPFRFLHVGDTHLALWDERDDQKKRELAESRSRDFPFALRMLDDAQAKAEELGCLIVHTGDVIGFISEKNLDRMRRYTSRNDVLFAAGNHEYYQYIFGENLEATQRQANIEKVQKAFVNDIRFSARQINGVNIVTVDNGLYHFEQWQLDRLKAEIARGLPILLCLHVPLYAPDVYEKTREVFGRALWMMSVPEALMGDCTEEEREEQKEDAVTREAYELITHTDSIKAVFAGHMHYDFVSELTPTLKQYIVNVDSGNIVTVQ